MTAYLPSSQSGEQLVSDWVGLYNCQLLDLQFTILHVLYKVLPQQPLGRRNAAEIPASHWNRHGVAAHSHKLFWD